MVRVRDVLGWIDGYAPFRYAASWDRCGLQVGDPEARVARVLVALDPTSKTLDEAARRDCQCLVTHHPIIFQPLAAVREDRFPAALVCHAIRRGIAVIAAHTNLDAVRGGTNEELFRLFSVEMTGAIEVEPAWKEESRYVGIGGVGVLASPMRLGELARKAAHVLGCRSVRTVGHLQKEVQKIAVCSGSGGSLIEEVLALAADVYITGDLKYHESQRAREADLALIDVGHFASERPIVAVLAAFLRSRAESAGTRMEVVEAVEEEDPFNMMQIEDV